MPERKLWLWLAVAALLAAQAAQVAITQYRESLTFDEGNHMYAGYRMWKTGDFGLNPEHPPLVKLLATVPVLGDVLWMPPLKGIFFKGEAYLGGRDWLEHNDGASQGLVFRMRMAAGLLALGLSLSIFFAAREWFGDVAALIAMTLAVFDPNLLAHSGLVTTDIGASLFFLLAIYAFYRLAREGSWLRLVLAGVTVGLLLATKHSGILIGPTLLLLAGYEIVIATGGTRRRLALRLSGSLAAIAAIGVLVLWAFYGFRYAARPAGLALTPPLAAYSQGLTNGFEKSSMSWMAHWHLLPESYLMGMVDVKVFAKNFSTNILGTWYPNGLWWYFPVLLTIKATLGLLALWALAGYAMVTGKFKANASADGSPARALGYLLIPGAFYLAVAIANGLNIGIRHILPAYVLLVILAGAGAAALVARSRAWVWVCLALVVAHVASALSVFPNSLAYVNEAWGGAKNAHRLVNDSNVDWGRQLKQVKEWEDRHPGEECWFAYTVRPFIRPEMYGVHCHILPNGLGDFGEAGAELVPAVVHGSVLLSAGEVDGGIWPSKEMNPYRGFASREPDEEIDYGVLVYRGDIPMGEAGGLSRALLAGDKLDAHHPEEALALAEDGVKLAPGQLYEEWALGDAAAALGQKDEARGAYQAAIVAAGRLDAERQAQYVTLLEASLKKL